MITDFSFGKIVVNGIAYNSDIKIVQGRVIQNWWRRRGHEVDTDDLKDVLSDHPEVLILGRGDPGLMKATSGLRAYLQQNRIELIEENTSRAMATFNRLLAEGKRVAAGFHVGC